jgi:hypothetical protein
MPCAFAKWISNRPGFFFHVNSDVYDLKYPKLLKLGFQRVSVRFLFS